MLNKTMLIGRLGRDPEVKYTPGGKEVTTFSIATDESYKNDKGEKQKRTEWHRIVLWEKNAEVAGKFLKKGALIFVEGRIQSREWEKDGEKHRSFEIVAHNFRMLEPKSNGHREPGEDAAAGYVPTDEDIPF